MEGPSEGYEEHPEEIDDAYSTMVYPIDLASLDSPSVRRQEDRSALASPHADQANKLHYLFFNPPHDRVEEHIEEQEEHEKTASPLAKKRLSKELGAAGKNYVTTKSSSGSLPKAVVAAQLGYEVQEFDGDGYVGPESLSGYLNFGPLKDDDTIEDSNKEKVKKDQENPWPVTASATAPEDEENYVDHESVRPSSMSRESVDQSTRDPTRSGSMIEAPVAAVNKGPQSIVLARAQGSRSSLEMEDLFSEILRKTGAVYGRQKLMEFLHRTASFFGETQLIQAIQKSVSVTVPSLITDEGHMSRCVWNEKFQAALEIKDSAERNERLAALRSDFISTASSFGRIILSERFLPVYRKSIKPVNLGGVAGGTKYLVHGVLYKFAEDVDLGAGRWMYGGHERNDAAAAKACGNELKGLGAVFQACAELDLRVPLMCLVDFSGFRISAQAFLPVGTTTLVYGSRDAGKTILSGKGSPVVMAMMSRLAERLRLEPHVVTDSKMEKHVLYGPTDIEVHLGYDGRYYLLDSARLMPPQTPPRNAVRAVFYQLFRSEFLTWYNIPLSPDGYTRFGQHNWRVHNAKLRDATEALIYKRIPEFASQLTSRDAKLLTSLMHAWGINNRFLGYVRHQSTNKEVREAALLEMVARTLQKMLQERLRDEMGRIRAPQTSPYLHLISDFFNMITSDAWFWKRPKMIKSRLLTKFGNVCLEEHERDSKTSLAPLIDMPQLLSRLCHLGGIQLRSGPILSAEDLNEPFVTSDFTIEPRITEMDIASMALAEQYRKQAKRKLGLNKLTLLQNAAEIFAKAAICNPRLLSNRVRWLRVLVAILRNMIRTGKRFGNRELEAQFSRSDKVLADCQKECKTLGYVPCEVLFCESSLVRQKYHQFITLEASSMVVQGLEYWTSSYKLLLAAANGNPGEALHIGLNVLNPVRIHHRKAKRWVELVMGLDHLTDMRHVPQVVELLEPVVAEDIELAEFLVKSLKTRERLFGVLFAVFRRHAHLLRLLKIYINGENGHVALRKLSMAFLDDSVVAPFLQLCSNAIESVDLSNCSGCTNDVLFMLERISSLKHISLRRLHRVTDEGVIRIAESFSNLVSLNLSGCVKLTDRCLHRMRCLKLEKLILKRCVLLEGEFLNKARHFASVRELDLEDCHRITKPNLSRISVDTFPVLEKLNLNNLFAASGQVVHAIVKHCPLLRELALRNVNLSEKAFRLAKAKGSRVLLERLCVHSTDFDDEALSSVATFPNLLRLNMKQCYSLTSQGLVSFSRLRPADCAALTHLDVTDVTEISEDALHTLLCGIPGAPISWRSLKLRGCNLGLVTLQTILSASTNLEALSLAGRSELDLGNCFVVTRSLRKLVLEACHWLPTTLKMLLGPSMVSLKLRSCPNLGNEACQFVASHAMNIEKLHIVAIPITRDGLLFLKKLNGVKKLTLHDLSLSDHDVLPLLQSMMGGLSSLSLRELQITDVAWLVITSLGTNLKRFKMSRCPIRNQSNRLCLMPKLEILGLAAFSTPPFDHSETAAELNQLRELTLDAAICANVGAFESLGYSRSLQKLIVLPIVPPQWWRLLTEKPIRQSLQVLFLSNAPQAALPFLRGFTLLTEINLRESAAKQVFPDVYNVFPLLVFPGRTLVSKSRNSSMLTSVANRRQQSLVRAILNTSTSMDLEDDSNSSDHSTPDITMGWALITEAQMELQLNISKLLLESGYKLVLVYRGNKHGCAELLDFAAHQPDRIISIKLVDLFAPGGIATLEKRVECLELVVLGYCAPAGQSQEQDSSSLDYMRRAMQEIPYSFLNLQQLLLPLVKRSSQKLVVVTTSVLGSITDNFTGRLIALRAATAALNQIVKSVAIEAEAWNGSFVLVSPQRSEDSEEESVSITAAKFVKTIGKLSLKDNGRWLNTNQQTINW